MMTPEVQRLYGPRVESASQRREAHVLAGFIRICARWLFARGLIAALLGCLAVLCVPSVARAHDKKDEALPDVPVRLRVIAPSAVGMWLLRVDNEGDAAVRIAADVRLLSFDVFAPATKRGKAAGWAARAAHCDGPAAFGIEDHFPIDRELVLEPGQSYVEEFDPRLICFGKDAELIRAGAKVKPAFGWPPNKRRGMSTAPFVADDADAPRKHKPVRKLTSPTMLLSYSPPVVYGQETSDKVEGAGPGASSVGAKPPSGSQRDSRRDPTEGPGEDRYERPSAKGHDHVHPHPRGPGDAHAHPHADPLDPREVRSKDASPSDGADPYPPRAAPAGAAPPMIPRGPGASLPLTLRGPRAPLPLILRGPRAPKAGDARATSKATVTKPASPTKRASRSAEEASEYRVPVVPKRQRPAPSEDELAARLTLTASRYADALHATEISLSVQAHNVGQRPLFVALRDRMLSFSVEGPDGVVTCPQPPEHHKVPRDLFATLHHSSHVHMDVLLAEMCPPKTFDRPGLYRATPTLHADAAGKEYGLNAATGTVTTRDPGDVSGTHEPGDDATLVRMRRGERRFYSAPPRAVPTTLVP